MRILKGILYFAILSVFLFSCKENENNGELLTVKFSKRVDSLIMAQSEKNPILDSLRIKIGEAKSDTSKINLLIKAAKLTHYKEAAAIASEIQGQAKAIKYDEGYYMASLTMEYYFANTTQFDSLKRYHNFIRDWALKNNRRDIIISELINYAGAYHMLRNFTVSDSILLRTLELIKEYRYDNKYQIAMVYYYLGKNKNSEFDNKGALEYLNKAVENSLAAKNDDLTGDIYFRIGECYLVAADFNNSLKAYGNSETYSKKANDQKTVSSVLSAIGEIYLNKLDMKKAYENLFRSLELARKTKYTYQEAYTLSSLASVFQTDSNFTEALQYFKKSNEIYESFNRESHESEILLNDLNIATVYMSMQDYDSALKLLNEISKKINEENDPSIAAEALDNLSEAYYFRNDLLKAEELGNRALSIARKNELTSGLEHTYNVLYKIFEKKKNFEKAHYYYKAYAKLTDSLSNKTQIKRFAELENDIREKELKAEHDIQESRLRSEKLKKEQELKQQQITSWVIAVGFIVLLFFAVLIYRSLQENKKKTKIISEQKKEVEQQNEIIEEKKKEVLDSIEYAKKIQEAILPSDENIKKIFPRSFVFYKPKDIVAGDFYWLEKVNDKILIAVGDCTGHGVPGAMVSVVCSNAMNRAVKEFGLTDPGMILDKVREIVVDTFEKSGSEVQDGMDISLLILPLIHDQNPIAIEWAGANNPLWYISDSKFFEVKANKQPVGKYIDHKPFTTQKLNLKKGDLLYLISDGFADQFGGPKGKKFKYKALNELLLQNSKHPAEAQKRILENAFENWKGNLEQVDDVCILGIQL